MIKTEQSYEILNGLHPYGNMYISIHEGHFSEGLVVKFVKKNGSEWIANFESGKTNLEFVAEIKNSNEIIVIANGICYFINKEIKQSIKTLENYFRRDFQSVFEFENKFVLVGSRSVAIVEHSEKIKYFDNLCSDFINGERLENKSLIGTLNSFNGENYTKTDFFLNLNTFESKEMNNRKQYIKEKNNKTKLKKWWKIW